MREGQALKLRELDIALPAGYTHRLADGKLGDCGRDRINCGRFKQAIRFETARAGDDRLHRLRQHSLAEAIPADRLQPTNYAGDYGDRKLGPDAKLTDHRRQAVTLCEVGG